MAKVTITFEDAPNNQQSREVNVTVDFEPPLEAGQTGTPAQYAALDVIDRTNQSSDEG